MNSIRRIVCCFGLTALLVAGCSDDSPNTAPDDTGATDAEVSDATSGVDAGTDASEPDVGVDAGGVDAGDPCDGVVCPGLFEFCSEGSCVEWDACVGDCDGEFVCQGGRCVPPDVDLDGDGQTAATDCDDTEPWSNDGAEERCGAADDDCDGTVDEGDPSLLCDWAPGGGICFDGSCGCAPDTYDVDRAVPGCECAVSPPLAEGRLCGTAIDLGEFDDSGTSRLVTGNALPVSREDWYRFRAADLPDTTCDNFHVRVQLNSNPGDVFELEVFEECGAAGVVSDDFVWATDLGADVDPKGECPCSETGSAGVNACSDNSKWFFVRVRRTGEPDSCTSYQFEVSNGVYDSAG